MLTKNETVRPDVFENWPDSYYEEDSLVQRKAYLEQYLNDHPDSTSDLKRHALLEKRLARKGKQETDLFIRAWMMIRICEEDRISFLNRKSKEKELRENLRQLCVLDYEMSDELIREWRDFARKYLIICCESHSYRTAAFGLIPMSDEKTALRIAREIDTVTRIVPSRFGLENACAPFRDTVIDVYCSLLENGSGYWQKYNS